MGLRKAYGAGWFVTGYLLRILKYDVISTLNEEKS